MVIVQRPTQNTLRVRISTLGRVKDTAKAIPTFVRLVIVQYLIMGEIVADLKSACTLKYRGRVSGPLTF